MKRFASANLSIHGGEMIHASEKAGRTLSLVIPAYNEEERLPVLFERLERSAEADVARAGFELLETVIVDDGSVDRTGELLRKAAAADPKLVAVLGSGHNQGKGAAVATGVQVARGDYVLIADVDLSTPLRELDKLAAALRGPARIAIGSRALDGSIVERGPAHRKLLGGGFNGIVRLLTGLEVRDTQCGFKLIETALARQLLAEQTCPGFSFDVELLLRARLAGARIAEAPVLYVHDSRSRVRVLSESVRMLRDVVGLAYRTRPHGAARSGPSPTPRAEPHQVGSLPAEDLD
jgi:dolichyl-phosphate beta-glucosyltransferase